MIPLFIKSLTSKQAQTYTPTTKVSAPAAKPEPEKDVAAPAGTPDMKHFAHLLGLLSDRKPGGDFGPHNVESGHHVAFAAGSFTGSGKVSATGRDGLTVEDEARREHRVHWREVTGHFAPEKAEADAKPAKAKGKDGA